MKLFSGCLLACSLYLVACQKSVVGTNETTGTQGTTELTAGDSLTYEVITSDSAGWFGIWNEPNGTVGSNTLDSGMYGSPIYFQSGWRYTFLPPATPFQAYISVANKSYSKSITVNLYRGNTLLKTVSNDAMPGVAKLLVDVAGEELKGTAANPVVTYEVLVTKEDTSKFESDGWLGQWKNPDGKVNSGTNPLLMNFAFASGWKYSFKPQARPFEMRMALSPYTKNGATVTANFYVNNQLVKSVSGRDWLYGIVYTVQ